MGRVPNSLQFVRPHYCCLVTGFLSNHFPKCTAVSEATRSLVVIGDTIAGSVQIIIMTLGQAGLLSLFSYFAWDFSFNTKAGEIHAYN